MTPRLDPSIAWLRRLDWFMQEPGLWTGDANENFLGLLAEAWASKPADAEFLGNGAFHRLFLTPRALKPRLVVKGSGRLTGSPSLPNGKPKASNFPRLTSNASPPRPVASLNCPTPAGVELDTNAVQGAHEAMADMGVDGLIAVPQKVGLEHVAHLDDDGLTRFADTAEAKALRERVRDFKGVPAAGLPKSLQAELRPYQKDGFDFLAHLVQVRLGGILADDMGLGETLQTLTWLAWLKGTQHQESQAFARHLPRLRAPQLAPRGRAFHAGYESPRA